MNESRVRTRMAAEGLAPSTWENGPGDRYAAHRHGYDKVLVAATGSIVFGLPELGIEVDLHAGDRLDLPAGTLHDAVAGPGGITCLEAHQGVGALHGAPRHRPGWAAAETAEPRDT